MPGGALLGILWSSPGWTPQDWIAPGLIGLFFGWLAFGIGGLFFPKCELLLFFEKRTLKIRKNTERAMTLLFLLFLPGAFFFPLGPEWMQPIPVVAVISWILGTLGLIIFQRKLRCPVMRGGRFGITGFHPKTLSALAGVPWTFNSLSMRGRESNVSP
jgi:hypothetical protein